MPSTSRRRGRKRPGSPAPARDWAALSQDILFAVFLKIGPREILRGVDRVCMAWRRVAVGEPLLWRCLNMAVPVSWWRWRTAVRRGAGQCECFEARGCGNSSLLYLVERAPPLKKLRLLDCRASFAVLNEVIKKLPFLEDLEIELPDFGDDSYYKKLIGSLCEACPHLKKLSLRLLESYNYLMDVSEDEIMLAIPVMHKLQTLELTDCDFTVEELVPIIHNCPILESLNIADCYKRQMIMELQHKFRDKNLSVTVSNEEFSSQEGSEWESNDEFN